MESVRSTQIRTAVIATAIGLPLAASAFLQVSYRNGPVHIAFEAVAGFIALLAAFLTLGRATQSRQTGDLVLTAALTALGVMNLVGALVPEAGRSDIVGAGFLVGAAMFATSSFLPAREFKHLGRSAAMLTVWIVGGTGVVTLSREVFVPTDFAIQVTMAIFYISAYLGFARGAAREGDQFLRLLASASVLAGLARVNYAIPPGPASGALSAGDALRMGFYLLMMIAALHEIVDYWRQRARLVASEERRRIARELHDGLAQELFFIATKSGILARKEVFPGAAELHDAAQRALIESRRAIASLSTAANERLDVALMREAEGTASRFSISLDLQVQQGLEASAATHSALVRIAREAITNAARHAGAAKIKVRLAKDDGFRLSVSDDGSGFDPQEVGDDSFGLASMRERVRALGGELRIDSALGRGTVVEAVVP